MTPTNASLGELDPARLARLDAGGALLSGDAPMKEAFLHRAMDAAREDDGAVVRLHSAMSAMTGRSAWPSSVKLYSVLGGTTENSRLDTSPQASSSFSSLDRIRSLIGGHARRSSEYRRLPLRRSVQTILAFGGGDRIAGQAAAVSALERRAPLRGEAAAAWP